jgi:hypothetical protein
MVFDHKKNDKNYFLSTTDAEFVRYTFDSWNETGNIESTNEEVQELHRRKKRTKGMLGRFLQKCWEEVNSKVEIYLLDANLKVLHTIVINMLDIIIQVLAVEYMSSRGQDNRVIILNDENNAEKHADLIVLRYFGIYLWDWLYDGTEILRTSRTERKPVPDRLCKFQCYQRRSTHVFTILFELLFILSSQSLASYFKIKKTSKDIILPRR